MFIAEGKAIDVSIEVGRPVSTKWSNPVSTDAMHALGFNIATADRGFTMDKFVRLKSTLLEGLEVQAFHSRWANVNYVCCIFTYSGDRGLRDVYEEAERMIGVMKETLH